MQTLFSAVSTGVVWTQTAATTAVKKVIKVATPLKEEKIYPACFPWHFVTYPFYPKGSAINIQETKILYQLPDESTTGILQSQAFTRTFITPASRNDIIHLLPNYIHRTMLYYPPPDLKDLIPHNMEEEKDIIDQNTMHTEDANLNRVLYILVRSKRKHAILWHAILRTVLCIQAYYAKKIQEKHGHSFVVDQDITLTAKDVIELEDAVKAREWETINLDEKKISSQTDRKLIQTLHKIVLDIKTCFFNHQKFVETFLNVHLSNLSKKMIERCKIEDLEPHLINLSHKAPSPPNNVGEYRALIGNYNIETIETLVQNIEQIANQLQSECARIQEAQALESAKAQLVT